jgi:xanthine dehydrogenase YagS FAD-binding subunit
MKAFEYAAPRHEAGVLELLSPAADETAILAGGTDLVGLMKQMIVSPRRVVNIKNVSSMRGVGQDSLGTTIGAVTTLDDLLEADELEEYPAIKQAIRGINSATLQAQGTIGGELFQRPRCWYFRNGYGLLGDHGLSGGGGRMAATGENRFHAIFGNAGPAKFVCPSRLAPALIALGARARILGPKEDDEAILPVETLFRTPRDARQREHALEPNQLLTHILLPRAENLASATYEVRQSVGPDYPLAAAAAALAFDGDLVSRATIVLGQVAPIPWVAQAAAQALVGRVVNADTARVAGEIAVAKATPLAENAYKVRLASVSVQRAVLLAAGLETGGF